MTWLKRFLVGLYKIVKVKDTTLFSLFCDKRNVTYVKSLLARVLYDKGTSCLNDRVNFLSGPIGRQIRLFEPVHIFGTGIPLNLRPFHVKKFPEGRLKFHTNPGFRSRIRGPRSHVPLRKRLGVYTFSGEWGNLGQGTEGFTLSEDDSIYPTKTHKRVYQWEERLVCIPRPPVSGTERHRTVHDTVCVKGRVSSRNSVHTYEWPKIWFIFSLVYKNRNLLFRIVKYYELTWNVSKGK